MQNFSFFEDIPLQSSKLACPQSCLRRGHTVFFFRYGGFYIFKILLLNTPKYHFLPECSFKICEMFFRNCPRCHCGVRVVNNYADTLLTATVTRCLHKC